MDLNFLINKAVKHHVQGRIEKAELNYKKILKFDPKYSFIAEYSSAI